MKGPIPDAVLSRIVHLRRDLHRYPELAGEESLTSEKIADFLREAGLSPETGIGGHGITAEIPGSKPSGPFVVLRADMDALPVLEETGLPFASQRKGLMHACGHDGHMAMLVGAAVLLAEAQDLPCPVRLVFQPAEETAEGARAMIGAGVLKDAGCILGGHLDRHYPLGAIIMTNGAVNASSDHLYVRISGKGGHAGRPHETVDPVVASSLLVVALQTVVSREVNPDHPSVVSIGRISAGKAANVIADTAELEGSIRALDNGVRGFLHEAVKRVCQSVGSLHGAKVDVVITPKAPPVINHPGLTDAARAAAAEVAGPDRVYPLESANMGSEDFSWYLEHVPGCYVRFGITSPGKEFFPAHSSRFDFDEQVLGIGAAYYAAAARAAGRWLLGGRTAA